MTKVLEADSPKHISVHSHIPIMSADDKCEILRSLDRLNVDSIETVRSCHSPAVTDLENQLVVYFQKK